jgi:hypothetical protein
MILIVHASTILGEAQLVVVVLVFGENAACVGRVDDQDVVENFSA